MGKKTSKTTTKASPWQPAQGDILGSIGTVRDVVGNNQGNLEGIAGDIRGYLPQLGQMAFGDNPLLNAGNQYATDVLGGKYLNGNQYLDGMIGQTANDVTDRVNALFSKSGASLGTQHAGILAKELANAENSLRYGNYAQERQLQQGAASMIPGLNASQYAGVSPYLAAAQTAGTLPYAGLGALSPIIGLAGGSGTQSSTQPGGWGSALLGAASNMFSFAPISLSDRRLKTNIKLIRRDPDGLGWYEWNWRSDPNGPVQRGVIADEVKELRPQAYVPNFVNGYDGVNYAALREAA